MQVAEWVTASHIAGVRTFEISRRRYARQLLVQIAERYGLSQ